MTDKKLGKPTLLTPQLQAEFVRYMQNGATIKDACAASGIGYSTYELWQAIANAWQSGNHHPNMPRKVEEREAWAQPYVQFVEAVKNARAIARIAAVVRIRKDESWQAQAWFLERSDPTNWGRHTYAHIQGLDDLLRLAKEKGIDASDIFNAMIAELMNVDADEQSGA